MRKAPPATPAQLAALETAIGRKLPADLAEWIGLINGYHHGVCLSGEWEFLSADEIAMHWGFFADPAQGIAPIVERTEHPHRVRVPADHRTRIPFAHDHTGNVLAIDDDPVQPQHRGQVLCVSRDTDGGAFVIFDSFADLLDAVSNDIATGRLTGTSEGPVYNPGRGRMRPMLEFARAFREPHWAPSDADRAFAAGLTPDQRSMLFVWQNQLLKSADFPVEELDLVRSVVLTPELLAAADPAWLKGFPCLDSVRIAGDATPRAFEVLAELRIIYLNLQCTTASGLAGVSTLAGHKTLLTLVASCADQAAFDVFASCPSLVQLWVRGDAINDLSKIVALPALRELSIGDASRPDLSPVWRHPAIDNFSLTWRQ